MMAPEVYEEARRTASMHVQLWRAGPTRRERHAGSVRVDGRIVRIFRDRDRILHWGQRVTFVVPVIDRERTAAPTLSGTIYHDWDWMGRARWLEAFLESWQGEMQLVHSQILALRHPTLRPVCGPEATGTLCSGTFEVRR